MESFTSSLTRKFDQWSLLIFAIIVGLGMAMCSSITLAQSGAGSIQGTVTDSTGALIPGASIHVVNQATGVTSDTKTNSVGFYQVPALFAGTYVVSISAPGMKTATQTVELLVAQNAVINPVMTAGPVTQQVQVSANIAQLTTTDNGTIGATLENSRINQLPMNGRFLYLLAGETTPGLEGNGQRDSGLLEEGMEYVADGVSLDNREIGTLTQSSVPDPDSVQEVRIDTSNTSAQFSTPATAIITTKSGTNTLHGTFFETARNNAWGIAKGRSDPPNLIAPHLVRNEFGASAGGPIIIPKLYHGKDKTFWFFAFERYSLAQSSNELAHVPTLAMRGSNGTTGDFSGLINSAGVLQQLYDPATTTSSSNCNGTGTANQYCRAPFANNQIPIGRLSPTSKILFAIEPVPTSTANPLVTTNLTAPAPIFNTTPTFTFRIDHVFDENNRAYTRFTGNQLRQYNLRQPVTHPGTIAADGFPAGSNVTAYAPNNTIAAAVGYTHIFSPTFYSETVLSQQWYTNRNFTTSSTNDYEQQLGLPNNFGTLGWPQIGQSPSLIYPFVSSQFIYDMSQIVSNIDENLTKTAGKHQLMFGGHYRHERMGTLPNESQDSVNFGAYATALENPASGSNLTATSNTGYADADMFLGAASSYTANHSSPYAHFHDMGFAAYFQDNYRVARNLTVNLGLRWEGYPAPWVKYGLGVSFDLKNDAMVLAAPTSTLISEDYTVQPVITNLENLGVNFETPGEAGLPSDFIRNYYDIFSPRVGMAWQPFGTKHGTVIRGAYGRYSYPNPVYTVLIGELITTPFAYGYTQSYIAANQSPDGLANYLLRAPQSVVMGTNSANVVNSTGNNAILPGITAYNLAPDYAPTFVTQTNFTIEQPMKGNAALRISWAWTHGTNLNNNYYYNEHPSTFSWEVETGTALPTGTYAGVATGPYDKLTYGGSNHVDSMDGMSNDNALQANYQRLYHSGFAYQIYYVWSVPLRMGGGSNTVADDFIYTAQSYGISGAGTWTPSYGTPAAYIPPPARPTGIASYADWHGLIRYQDYLRDIAIPMHHIGFNGIYDLPFGTGKRFLGNSKRFVDEVVGGWQVAGAGSVVSQSFQPLLTNWGPTSKIQVYKHNAPIMDCRSGVCYKAYEWFNGYIAPSSISGNTCSNSAGAKVVSGLPSGWAPYQTPIDNDCNSADAAYKYYSDNYVDVTLSNGTVLKGVAYSPGPQGSSPFSHTVINGPINYSVDLSAFKVFPITERVNLRMNVDAFNALNVQGYTNPSATDGTEQVQPGVGQASSYNTPRQLQFTLRLTF